MDIQPLVPSLATFLVVICTAIGALLLMRGLSNKRIRDRLQDVIMFNEDEENMKSVILRDMDLSTLPFLNRFLKNVGWARKLDTLLTQADVPLRMGSFILLILLLGSLGAFMTGSTLHQPLFAVPVGFMAASVPILWARRRKQKRLRKFEEQFPDALDMLTSALRSGLAWTGAIQVVADESPDPVAQEFRVLFEENRLGLDMRDVMKRLAERVDSVELRLFVAAVILQRETGGNLAEVLEGTAAVIRERFRILGDVRSMTAQARLSGFILFVLPLAIAGVILFTAPTYLTGLIADPVGRYLILGAALLQITGFLIMRRIVDIKV
jgi:tight adherence protein B